VALTHDDLAAVQDLGVFVHRGFVRVHFPEGLLRQGEGHIIQIAIMGVNVKVILLQKLEAFNLLRESPVAFNVGLRCKRPATNKCERVVGGGGRETKEGGDSLTLRGSLT